MSPNFPNNYPHNISCTYTIQSPLGLPVTLIFTSFEVEPGTSASGCYDFVRVSMLFADVLLRIILIMDLPIKCWGCRSRDRMVAGFTTTYAISTCHNLPCEFESHSGEVYSIQQVGDFLRVPLKFIPATSRIVIQCSTI